MLSWCKFEKTFHCHVCGNMLFYSKLSFWASDQSNSINGSDGSAFHPLLTKDERIYIFTPDLCRYSSAPQELSATYCSHEESLKDMIIFTLTHIVFMLFHECVVCVLIVCQLRGQTLWSRLRHFSSHWNGFAMKCGTDTKAAQKINPNDFNDPETFTWEPPTGQNFGYWPVTCKDSDIPISLSFTLCVGLISNC